MRQAARSQPAGHRGHGGRRASSVETVFPEMFEASVKHRAKECNVCLKHANVLVLYCCSMLCLCMLCVIDMY